MKRLDVGRKADMIWISVLSLLAVCPADSYLTILNLGSFFLKTWKNATQFPGLLKK
jgi:hypothetical protein